ncbi:MAG: hypothetical protein ACTHWA_06200 [Arachnia sp.]
MNDWIGIVVALVVGVPLLLTAVLVDLRRRRAEEEELAAPPLRGNSGVDALVPDYISQDAVDALPAPGSGLSSQEVNMDGTRLAFGHVDDDFATAGDRADLRHARILMVDDAITSFRELLVPLRDAAAGEPIVIVAAAFHPDVLTSLKANRRVGQLPVVAVEANLAELMQLQDLVGGQVLESADLKAGWMPPGALGCAEHWSSNRSSSVVLGMPRGQG